MSSTFASLFKRAFPKYVVDGVPSSGIGRPDKDIIQSIGGTLDSALDAAASSASAAVATLSQSTDASVATLTDRIATAESVATSGVAWTTNTVRVRATGNTSIASGLVAGTVVNGVTLETGDVVFLGSQSAASTNGLYSVPASGTAPRVSWANSAAGLAHVGFLLQEGAVGIGERWTLPMDSGDITLGTTALNFALVGVEVDYATEVLAARNGQDSLSAYLAILAAQKTAAERALLQKYATDRQWPNVPICGTIAAAEQDTALLTVSRAGAATRISSRGLLDSVAVNALQHAYDPSTGEYLGWRLEPARTNLLTYSQDYSQAYWTKTRCTSPPAQTVTGPDGVANSAFFLEETTDNGVHAFTRSGFAVSAGDKISFACWLNPAFSRDWGYLVMDGSGFTGLPSGLVNAHFQLTGEGSVLGAINADSTSITAYPDGWYRCEIHGTAAADGTVRVYPAPANSAGSAADVYAGEAGKGIGVGPSLLVAAPSAGSDIATSGATATRGVTSIIESHGDASAVSIFADFRLTDLPDAAGARVAGVYVDNNNYAFISLDAAGKVYAGYMLDGTAGTINGLAPAIGERVVALLVVEAGRQALAINGAVIDASSPVDAALVGDADFVVGSMHGASAAPAVIVRSAFSFDRALSDDAMGVVSNPAFFSRGAAAGGSTDLTQTERTAWAGAATSSGFSVFSDVALPVDTVLKVARTSDMWAPVYTSDALTPADTAGTSKTYHSILAAISNLDPDTDYWWQLYQGSTALGAPRRIHTPAAAGAAHSFRFIPISCTDINPATVDDIFDAIVAENPAFLLHMGDLVYENIDTDDIGAKRDGFVRRALGGTSFSYMYRKILGIYMPDNHDGFAAAVGLELDNYATVMANMRQVYRETVPHYPFEQQRLAEDDSNIDHVILTQRWDWGRVRFLMPDLNSQRDHSSTPHKILGDIYWDQKQWLLDQLDEADADPNIKLIVLVSQETWLSKDPANPDDTGSLDAWDEDFPEDQAAVVDKMESLDTLCIVVCGDGHQGIADDGTNGAKGSSGTARIANFMSSGLYQTWFDWGVGPGSWNGSDGDVVWTTEGEPIRLYAVVDVLDAGGDDLTVGVAFKSNPVDPDTKQATTRLSVSSDDVTPAVEFSAATAAGAHETTIDIGLGKTWFGPVGGADVAWSSSDGQTGSIHIKPNTSVATLAWAAPAAAGSYTITLSDPERCDLGSQTTCTVTVS